MARLSFLWHLHQPLYRTADSRVHAPWVLLHAAGEYLTLTRCLATSGLGGQVLNLTPVFLDQLAAYRDGGACDPLLEALRTPPRDLTPQGQQEIVRWARMLHPRQLGRWPRLAELLARTSGASEEELPRRLTVQDLTDLQILLVLAYAAPNLPWEPQLAQLAAKCSGGWSQADRQSVVDWLARCPGQLLEQYRALAARQGIEIATSPWAHPIVPLLLGTDIVADSWAPHPPPPVPAFAAPEDAARHIAQGLAAARSHGFEPVGCWPPEGAVSEAAVALYGQHGVQWLCTDEGILAASVGHPLSGETGVGLELFSPWQLPAGGPVLFFRHRGLSDFIGFEASRYPDEAQAARDLVRYLRQMARDLPAEAGIVLALDGENPWTSFPAGGAPFLTTLAAELAVAAELELVTLRERAASEEPRTLARLHPGSWIGGTFATWIGHPEKNRGWELLGRTRSLGAARGGTSWLAAEGSDWWWWLGDDNPTLLAPVYDELFRQHLRDACRIAGVMAPPELSVPIRSDAKPLRVPLSREWPPPTIDGKTTNYFEWAVAAWVDAPPTYRHLARIGLRSDGRWLFLRAELKGRPAQREGFSVALVGDEERTSWSLPQDRPQDAAFDSCLEARLPLPSGRLRLSLEFAGERLPTEGLWELVFQEVDEP
ncbi:MAG: hypothetical protein HXY19_07060 [Thermoanaerobaculaceae bacterium]|nr:hypothetical protein [Thermoanaerobaculaceae bacterium]